MGWIAKNDITGKEYGIIYKYRFEINDVLNYEYSLRVARDKERQRRNDEMIKELPF